MFFKEKLHSKNETKNHREGNSIVMELYFRGFSRPLSSKFGRKEFYQLYLLLKWFYAVDGEDYFQIFTFTITPKF